MKYALLIIDVQNAIYGTGVYPADVLQNIIRLAGIFRSKGAEVIYVQHNDDGLVEGTSDWQIVHDITPIAGEKIFSKNFNSAFLKTDLREYLADKSITHLVLAGMVTQYCINATCFAAFELGFKVIIPEITNGAYESEGVKAPDIHRLFNKDIWSDVAAALTLDELTEALSQ